MKPAKVFLGLFFALTACGQDPSFVDASLSNASMAPDSGSADAVVEEQQYPNSDIPKGDVTEDAAITPSTGEDSLVASVPTRPNVPNTAPWSPEVSVTPITGPAPSPVPAVMPLPAQPTPAPVVVPNPAPAPTPVPVVVPSPAPTPTPAPSQPTFPSQPTNPSSPVFTIPGLTPSEQVQVAQCINKWGRVPFTGTFTNVKRIKAAVSVYGIGNAINDTTQTAAPMLVLIDAGVNVMGNPVYNLLNNNGYYCMKVNVNVNTDFDINLACNAKLADNSVQVNVASDVGSETSVIGVNVGSNVQVNRMTPSRLQCVE